MIYLLDVNALVALGFINHEFHARVASWVRSSNSPQLAGCSITELGFLRVLAQAPAYGFTVAQARTLLLRLKEGRTSRLSSFQTNTMFLIFPVGSERLSKLEMVT
jgi:predicted nucleic acid-binding protein